MSDAAAGGAARMAPAELLQRGREALRLGEMELAERLLGRLAAEKPRLVAVHVLLGNIHRSRKDSREALRAYGRALELDRANVEALNNLGILLKDLGRIQDAVASFQSALEAAGERADIRYNLGNTYKETRNYSRAIEEFERAIAADPTFVLAYTNLGTVYQALGRNQEAQEVLSRGLTVDPNNATLHYNLGVIARERGDLKEARERFSLALKSRPGWPDALNNLGVVELALDDRKAAVRHFEEVVRRDPGHAKALNNLGVAHGALGDSQAAQRYLALAVKADAGYQRAFLNLGSLMEDQGYPDRAAIAYQKLVSLSPSDNVARLHLANSLIETGKHDQAIAQLGRILDSQPSYAAALRALGSAYQRKGDLERASECYRQLDEVAPDEVDYHMDLAIYWHEKKNAARAEAEVRRYLKGNAGSLDAGLLLGRLVLAQGRTAEAASIFEAVINAHPTSTEPYYYLARAYHAAGQTENAVEVLERLVAFQGERGDKADLVALEQSLEMHEKLIADYEVRFRERWKLSLSRIPDGGKAEEAQAEAEAPEAPDAAAQLIADAVPIISIGGLEPPLVVEEEEEILDLSAGETGDDEQTVEMDRVAPPTVITLIAPQDRRPEPAPAPWPQPGAAGAAGAAAPPQPAAAAPAAPQAQPSWQPQQQAPPQHPWRGPAPASGPVIIAAPPQPQDSRETRRQGQMLEDIQDELKTIRRALSERPQPVRVTVESRPGSAEPQPAREAGKKEPVPPGWNKMAGLMDYLAGLAGHLPEGQRRRFDASDIKMRMEYIRDRLTGQAGLKARVERSAKPDQAAAPGVTVTSSRLADTLRFLKGLATLLPDQQVATSLDSKLDSVILQIEDKIK